MENAAQHQKKNYNQTARQAPLLPGERVLVRRTGAKSRDKLADYWEGVPNVIVSQPNVGNPVYVLRPESGPGREQVLYRNLLRSCPLPSRSLNGEPQSTVVNDVHGFMPWIGFLPTAGTQQDALLAIRDEENKVHGDPNEGRGVTSLEPGPAARTPVRRSDQKKKGVLPIMFQE